MRAEAATALSLHSSFRTRLPADARPRVAAAVVAALQAAPSVKACLPTPVKKKVESVLSPAPSTKEAAALDNTLAAAAAAATVLRTAGVVVNDVGCTGMAAAAPACTAFVAVEARCTAPLAAPGTAVVAEAAAAVAVGADSRTAAASPACGPSPSPVQTTSCAVDGSPVALACAWRCGAPSQAAATPVHRRSSLYAVADGQRSFFAAAPVCR